MPDTEQSPERVRSSRRIAQRLDTRSEDDQVDSSGKAGVQNGEGPGTSAEPTVQASRSPQSSSALPADKPPSKVAIAKCDFKGTRRFLSASKGDRIVDIVQDGINCIGTIEGTEERGYFYSSKVDFVTDKSPAKVKPSDTIQETREPSPVKRTSSTAVTSPPPVRSSTPSSRQGQKSNSNLPVYVCYLLVGIFAVLAVQFGLPFYKPRWGKRPAINVTEIMGHFKSQDPEMWDLLRAGLLPSKREEVQTFLFLHNSKPTAQCLIDKLADNYCTVYKAGDLSFEDSFTSRMKDNLQNDLCMVVYDLENLNSDGIKVLKGFCDAYTPIVRNAKMFFALNAGQQQLSSRSARQILESKWSEWSTHDDFGGTVTRLSQNVLIVSEEDPVPC